MKCEVRLDPQAIEDLKGLRAHDRSKILDPAERILTVHPTHVSRSRIKRLRGLDTPQYRLRVGEHRVFYDVHEAEVHVLRVLSKAGVANCLREMGYEPEGL